MDELNKTLMYKTLSLHDQSLLRSIRSIALNLLSTRNVILKELLEKNSDTEEEWVSYVIVINLSAQEVLGLNLHFIDICIDNSPSILTSKIVFKFESGVS